MARTVRSATTVNQQPDRRAPADLEALAWLMDNSIPIPGTGRRVGLDAIIGFVPGLGDIVSSGASLFVILRAAGYGVPRITVARMLVNLGLDLTIGAIPVLGDAFDLWFKANERNVDLFRRHAVTPGAGTRGDWSFVLTVLVIGAVIIVAGIALSIWLLAQLLGAFG
ncbi:MAG TPA: DUF4112 domain-containing protein [Candidatus Limnocylindria bacterium]|nr:DUF4112 domain-containing protein [Candidatus Limnocylindria bacterium]